MDEHQVIGIRKRIPIEVLIPIGPLILIIYECPSVSDRRRVPVPSLAYNLFKYYSIRYYPTTSYGFVTRFLQCNRSLSSTLMQAVMAI